ncbi:MAG: hypothetical protein ABSF84_12300 [Acidimicrobiales bacterium]
MPKPTKATSIRTVERRTRIFEETGIPIRPMKALWGTRAGAASPGADGRSAGAAPPAAPPSSPTDPPVGPSAVPAPGPSAGPSPIMGSA